MAKDNPTALRQRWVDNTGLDYVTNIEMLTQHFSESPYGKVNGQHDFRGLPFTPLIELHKLVVKDADFTGAVLRRLELFGCRFDNCKWDKSEFDDVSFWDQCRFRSSSFSATTIASASFIDARFDDCLFASTRWKGRHNSFSGTTFAKCSFGGPIKNFDFGGSVLEDCKFTGQFHDITFHGWAATTGIHPRCSNSGEWLETPVEMVPNKMKGVDFSEANLTMANLTDFCYLDHAILPSQATHCVFLRSQETLNELLRRIEERYPQRDQNPIREKLIEYAGTFYKPHLTAPHAICNAMDFAKSLEPKISQEFFNLIVEASEKLGSRIFGIKK